MRRILDVGDFSELSLPLAKSFTVNSWKCKKKLCSELIIILEPLKYRPMAKAFMVQFSDL